MKKMIITSIILTGGLLMAGQAIGQFESYGQTLQREQSERSGAGINSSERSLGTGQSGSDTRQEGATEDQQSGFVSGTDQQRFQDTDQRQFQGADQRSRQQQMPLQQEFGVSPRFEDRDDIQSRQRQTQGRSDDQPGESSDMTREQGSPAIQGQGQGQGGSGMQSGPGSGSGGSGGQGGSGGSGGSGGR